MNDSTPAEYHIVKVQDFLKVPEDRLEECLHEFRDYLETVRKVTALSLEAWKRLGVKEPETEIGCFNWCDDGIRKVTLQIEIKLKQNGGVERRESSPVRSHELLATPKKGQI